MKVWVYHKTEPPKIVDEAEAKKLCSLDWADSPAAFLDLSDVIDMSNETEVQMVGEVMQETQERANDAIAVKTVRAKGLKILAEKYGVDAVGVKVPELRKSVSEAINGDGD